MKTFSSLLRKISSDFSAYLISFPSVSLRIGKAIEEGVTEAIRERETEIGIKLEKEIDDSVSLYLSENFRSENFDISEEIGEKIAEIVSGEVENFDISEAIEEKVDSEVRESRIFRNIDSDITERVKEVIREEIEAGEYTELVRRAITEAIREEVRETSLGIGIKDKILRNRVVRTRVNFSRISPASRFPSLPPVLSLPPAFNSIPVSSSDISEN